MVDHIWAEHMGGVKADLARRIGAIEWRAGPARVAGDVDAIRAIAARHQMLPALAVAHSLERALALGACGTAVHGWLSLLSDAVTCDRQDAAARDAFAAMCATRFAG